MRLGKKRRASYLLTREIDESEYHGPKRANRGVL